MHPLPGAIGIERFGKEQEFPGRLGRQRQGEGRRAGLDFRADGHVRAARLLAHQLHPPAPGLVRRPVRGGEVHQGAVDHQRLIGALGKGRPAMQGHGTAATGFAQGQLRGGGVRRGLRVGRREAVSLRAARAGHVRLDRGAGAVHDNPLRVRPPDRVEGQRQAGIGRPGADLRHRRGRQGPIATRRPRDAGRRVGTEQQFRERRRDHLQLQAAFPGGRKEARQAEVIEKHQAGAPDEGGHRVRGRHAPRQARPHGAAVGLQSGGEVQPFHRAVAPAAIPPREGGG